jgi:NAD(P)-dependent dehydrogenase (short-subunit alcohol dehydrogenase family)
VAVVSGGTGGIGAATCRLLSQAGRDVAFTFHSNDAKAKDLVAELESHGVRARADRVDLVDSDAVLAWVSEIRESWGPVKTVVHAAGPFVDMIYISNLTPEKFRLHVEAELIGFFNLCHATLPDLRQTRGSVTAVTSVAVRRHPIRDILSGAPKGGIEVLVRGIAREEGKYGVRANSIAPGVVVGDAMGTELISTGNFDERSQEFSLLNTPLRRFGQPDEIAQVVLFVASDAASYLSGQTINVDGGFTT